MLRRWLLRAFARSLLLLAAKFYETEARMMAEEKCKHEGQEGKRFCNDCGAKLMEEVDEVDDIADKVSKRVLDALTAAGVIKKKPEVEEQVAETLHDRIFRKKKAGGK